MGGKSSGSSTVSAQEYAEMGGFDAGRPGGETDKTTRVRRGSIDALGDTGDAGFTAQTRGGADVTGDARGALSRSVGATEGKPASSGQLPAGWLPTDRVHTSGPFKGLNVTGFWRHEMGTVNGPGNGMSSTGLHGPTAANAQAVATSAANSQSYAQQHTKKKR